MHAWFDVITAGALGPWSAAAPGILLAGLRWFGLLLWLPGLGTAGMTLRLRSALSILLAIVTFPATAPHFDLTAIRPEHIPGWLRWAEAAVGEFVLGSIVGLGVAAVFSALRLAGELIDQQAGLALQQTLDPFADSDTGPTSKTLSWLGLAAFFTLVPQGGELVVIDTLLRQFQVLPPGTLSGRPFDVSLLVMCIQQSLQLAVHVAGPTLALLSLITISAGWFGRTAPRLAGADLVTPLRLAACLTLLSASAIDVGALITDHFHALLDTAAQQFALLEPVARH